MKVFSALPKNLMVIYICLVIAGLGIGLVIPLIPMILNKAHVSPALIGVSATVTSVTGSLVAVSVGKFIDRAGGKWAVIMGLIIYAVALILFPLNSGIGYFMMVRAIEGIGFAGIWVGAETMINIISDSTNRARNLGLYATFTGLGLGLGPVLGTYLSGFSIMAAFAAASGVSLLAALTAFLYLAPIKVRTTKQEEKGPKFPVMTIAFPLFGAFTYAVMESSITSLIAIYLNAIDIVGPAMGAVITSFILGSVVSPPLAGMAADRWGKEGIIAIAMGVLATLGMAFNLVREWSLLLILASLIGAAMGAAYTGALSMLGERVPEKYLGVANGYFTTFFGLGSIIGPLAGGLGFQLVGREYIFYQVAFLGGIFLVYYGYRKWFRWTVKEKDFV